MSHEYIKTTGLDDAQHDWTNMYDITGSLTSPYMLLSLHLPQLPTEGLPSLTSKSLTYANDSFVSFSSKARQICLRAQDTPLAPVEAELP